MKNIVLIGFMGTGKTTTGRLLAARLRRPFFDIDHKIEAETGLTIPEIFERYGEPHFRALERAMVSKVARLKNSVIATGGGVVLHPDNLRRLRRNGIIISLTAPVNTILERTSRRVNRPLLAGEDRLYRISTLMAERDPLYLNEDMILDTSTLSPQAAVEQIISYLRQGGHLRGGRTQS